MASRHLAVLLVVGVVIAPATVGGVPAPRDQPADVSPPVQVFTGETLNISAVELTGGGTVGSESVTLVGESGAADGEIYSFSTAAAADFTGVTAGGYRVADDSDSEIEFVVSEPRITSVTITNQHGANVTNAWEPTGEQLTVTAEYTFASADRLDVTVYDPQEFDVTETVATDDRITTSGGSIQLDLSEGATGTYRIVLEGSALETAHRTVTVRIGPRATTTATTPAPTTTSEQPPVTTTPPTTTPPTTAPHTTAGTTTAPATSTASTTVPPSTQAPTTDTTIPGVGLLASLVVLLAIVGAALRRD